MTVYRYTVTVVFDASTKWIPGEKERFPAALQSVCESLLHGRTKGAIPSVGVREEVARPDPTDEALNQGDGRYLP